MGPQNFDLVAQVVDLQGLKHILVYTIQIVDLQGLKHIVVETYCRALVQELACSSICDMSQLCTKADSNAVRSVS